MWLRAPLESAPEDLDHLGFVGVSHLAASWFAAGDGFGLEQDVASEADLALPAIGVDVVTDHDGLEAQLL